MQVGNRVNLQLALAVLGFAAVGLVLLGTSRYGAGMSEDAIAYVTCATNLSEGGGYTCHYGTDDGVLYAYWPPLFPTLLAGLAKVGIDPLQGARLLNALAFGFIVFASGQLFRMFIRSTTLVILATLLVLFSDIFHYSLFALTEPLFTLFCILFVIYLLKFLKAQRPLFLLLASVFAALSFLQRYAGATTILVGVIVMISPLLMVPRMQRLKYATIFGVISAIPCAVWMIRNYILTSSLTGGVHTLTSPHSLSENIEYAARNVASWFYPPAYSGPTNVALVFAGVAGALFLIALIASVRYKVKTGLDTTFARAWPVAIFVLVYTLWLIITATVVEFEHILNPRFLLPIYAFVILLVFIAIQNASNLLKRRWPRTQVEYAVIAVCALWLMSPLLSFSESALDHARYGVGWNSVAFRESEVMEWVQTHELEGMIYSNAPEQIYFVTGITAKWSPYCSADIHEFGRTIASGNGSYLVWFNDLHVTWVHPFEELASELEMEEVAKVSDGGVYLLK